MNISKWLAVPVLAAGLFTPSRTDAQQKNEIVIRANTPVAEVQPTMWGIFFEDINLGADGGIYAELVKNRSFEFNEPMMGWKVRQSTFHEGSVLVLNRKEETPANPRYLRVTRQEAADTLGISNEGFRGMGIKKGLRYDFSMMYRLPAAGVRLRIELVSSGGQVIGSTTLAPAVTPGQEWRRAAVSFNATDSTLKGRLNIWFEGSGVIDMDIVSLFPTDTWKGRPGGMRADMIQMLADMKPGFIRFPGGCIVEGHDLALRYQWKKTLGALEDRQLIVNRWNYEFAHRPTPDYFQTFGLGFYEYFQLAEDIGASPLPILNCGMACQFNTAEVVALDELDPYVQDALDLIEFANGDVNTKWGKVRADLGHPAPFHLKMMGIGNENWGPQYIERLKVFTKAIKEKYPDIRLVNSSGTDPNGDRYEYLNKELRGMHADIIDEHYYRQPEWFLQNARRYDSFPRNASKIFAGEYAAQSDHTVSVKNQNNWQTALSEAAFMTGLERNADVVAMASYAPLFAHVDGWQWTPDLIWVDNLRVNGTPNYYVQKLFSVNKGTNVVPALRNNKTLAGEDSLYASAVIDQAAGELIVKMVNVSATAQTVQLRIEGIKKLSGSATLTVLQSPALEAVNRLGEAAVVRPADKEVAVKGGKVNVDAGPYSFTVFKVRMGETPSGRISGAK
ncbi:alpha-L-arabinofuranosidase C-terminal domain-containing protein [Flavitalea sp. BT771]|uniref:alpha-L-arabinofuranosidase C-terminal domain-containing protein n=1 Tax=Flavitalea sp. BT771 TaxID=3063329 RepID=UPI0026E1C9DC|nr:alpha-L-arabinofuranosidase C-terminal domain-containing protein [Flavitalea sp. BT771]MDO6432828.1 alpha-L-arabinofuranosidase C-terminal domain-containing protein [Flavitalea sp. BT771]MDV6221896.1 alpha-L-arabinofuranosidase C-terminal domain-containing protein [Flavitalea sp. BT771]